LISAALPLYKGTNKKGQAKMTENKLRDKHPEHMRISELSAYSKTPATAIRFYLRQGLLPQPLKTSKTMAYYTEEHLESLLEIRKLKEEGLAIEEIKRIVRNKTLEVSSTEEINTMNTSKREQIIGSAVSLFREKGYDGTRISEIPERAGIGKGTFYQIFHNKEELFLECVDSIFHEIGENVPQIQEEIDPLKKLLNRAYYFGHFQSHLIEMLNLIRGAAVKGIPHVQEKLDEVIKNLTEPIQNDLETAIYQGKIKYRDSTLLAHLLMGAAEYLIYYTYDNPYELDENLGKLWDMVLNGVLAKQNPQDLKEHE
jgi:AcrR family transcriptional regulator